MKAHYIIILLFTCALSAQDVQKVEIVKNDNQIKELIEEVGENEIKVDLLDMIAYPALDVTYERIIDTYSSYGASLFLNFGDSGGNNWSDIVSLAPFYRFYFFNKRDFGGSGFFVEVFSKLAYYKYDVETYYYDNNFGSTYEFEQEKHFDMALGVGIGQKWINAKGWTFEVMLGVGRYLFSKDESDSYSSNGVSSTYSYRPEAAVRGGFSIGKRF